MLAALELNDQSLLMQAEDGAMSAEPGFAQVTAGGIVTGEAAHAMAWREPQHIYNQYWCHLNQTPLAAREKWARHHGDIAFAQLRNLWQNVGEPDELMILAPGNMADAQLSLLLGMVEALPATVRLVMDSALAACLLVDRDTLHVDMQLHQTVLTCCRAEGGKLGVVEQEVFPALGMLQIQNSVARHVSELMIADYRYDPLHASDSEQAIYDRIPAWLTHLCWENELSGALESRHGQLQFIIQREAVRRMIAERLDPVRSFLDRVRTSTVLLSNPSEILGGLTDEFAGAEVAPQTVATDHCLSHYPRLLEETDSLSRVRVLQRDGFAAAREPVEDSLATHVLYGDRALSLRRPVSIHVGEGGVRLANTIDEGAALTVVLKNRVLETVGGAARAEAELPRSCRPGESIMLGGHQFRLIEVSGG